MKKTIYNIILMAMAVLGNFSCESPLDSTDLGVITEDVVWNDEDLINAYFADLYDQSEWKRHIDFYNQGFLGRYALWSLSDESDCRSSTTNKWTGVGQSTSLVSGQDTDHPLQIWTRPQDNNSTAWELLRAINEAIYQLENSAENLSFYYSEYRLGEAHFMRAFLYFRLARLYGGVPIITEVQDVSESFENLQVARSTEEATYDFISDELDEALLYLEDKDASDKSRINKWIIYAIKSRAMLYAGSIAENNDLLPLKDPNDLVGIDPSQATRFYQKSIDASMKLLPQPYGLGEAPFSLLPGSTVSDYRMIFDDPENSSECIMLQQFDGITNKANDDDVLLLPRVAEHPNWGAMMNTHWEVVQWFDYTDGISGTRLPDDSGDLADLVDDGNFYDLNSLFENKDPRFRASIALPGFELKDELAWFHDATAEGTASPDVPTQGARQNHIHSAICIYKPAHTDNPVTYRYEGNNPTNILRLGEIYLNYAEASLALGQGEGLNALNEIRTRAGMPLYTELNIENVRNERRIELFAEDHRYFDLQRWRIAQDVLTPETKSTNVNFTIDAINMTFQIKGTEERFTRIFEPEDYYLPIPLTEIQANDVLVQNPGF